MNKRCISLLGSTGSIGTQTLKVARTLGLKVSALAAKSSIELLEKQIREFKPEVAAVFDEDKALILRERVKDTSTKIVSGMDGVCECACINEADTVLGAMSGMIGLVPTVEAIKCGKDIALANKETLVTAGDIVTKQAKMHGVALLPVDSEHNAIFQSLRTSDKPTSEVSRILLTASGGPFFGKDKTYLRNVTKNDALKHPNWKMGAKITIDSATLMNKGLEIIEAMWLFGVSLDKIEVLVHRQSIVHSMVEYVDGAVIAELGTTDMCLAIQYALTYPNRVKGCVKPLDFTHIQPLTFEKPDMQTFGCLKLAIDAAKIGGSMPCVLNAANEVAVGLFLNDKIGFTDIEYIVSQAMKAHMPVYDATLDEILKIDSETRCYVEENFRGE